MFSPVSTNSTTMRPYGMPLRSAVVHRKKKEAPVDRVRGIEVQVEGEAVGNDVENFRRQLERAPEDPVRQGDGERRLLEQPHEAVRSEAAVGFEAEEKLRPGVAARETVDEGQHEKLEAVEVVETGMGREKNFPQQEFLVSVLCRVEIGEGQPEGPALFQCFGTRFGPLRKDELRLHAVDGAVLAQNGVEKPVGARLDVKARLRRRADDRVGVELFDHDAGACLFAQRLDDPGGEEPEGVGRAEVRGEPQRNDRVRSGRRRKTREFFDFVFGEIRKPEEFGKDPRERIELDRARKKRAVARVASVGFGADSAPDDLLVDAKPHKKVAARAFAPEFLEMGAKHFTVALVRKQCVEHFFEAAGMCGIRAECPCEVRREMKKPALEFAEEKVGRFKIGFGAGGV